MLGLKGNTVTGHLTSLQPTEEEPGLVFSNSATEGSTDLCIAPQNQTCPSDTSGWTKHHCKRDSWATLSGQAWDFPPPLEILGVTISSSAWEVSLFQQTWLHHPSKDTMIRCHGREGFYPQKALSLGSLRDKEQIGFSAWRTGHQRAHRKTENSLNCNL